MVRTSVPFCCDPSGEGLDAPLDIVSQLVSPWQTLYLTMADIFGAHMVVELFSGKMPVMVGIKFDEPFFGMWH